MADALTFIGFGEAGAAFARPGAVAYDRKTDIPGTRATKLADYAAAGVIGAESAAEAVASASIVLSLVTADQALAAAQQCAAHLAPGALFLDLNSVAPGTKRAAAKVISATGAHYVDLAVMAPVLPARLAVPLLVAGEQADAAASRLRAYGFTDVSLAGRNVGDASSIKMIRSVMVKGLEALTAECLLAAHRAGVTDAVLASLDASREQPDWTARADYNLDRMLVHGLRRAAEMEEVARTLSDLGVEPAMTRGTILRQRELGRLGIAPATGPTAKLAQIDPGRAEEAA
jgi:3-hydroxyisobutyrate dehydrogenase-like beta-hydroxyacid dehydrogenase